LGIIVSLGTIIAFVSLMMIADSFDWTIAFIKLMLVTIFITLSWRLLPIHSFKTI